MQLEVPMAYQRLDCFGVGHEGVWLVLIPQAVGVPDTVRAAQRAALDVVQAEAALAVLHDLTCPLW